MDEFTREELQDIREKAVKVADAYPSKTWKRALLRLADAADCLDAMDARTKDN